MKSVLRSIKPYWLYLILIGKKTVEVGKDCPKSKDWNRVVELYCSKDKKSFNRIPEKDKEWMQKYLGKVVCRFVCDKLIKFKVFENGTVQFYMFANLERSCLTYDEIADYIGKDKHGYAWHISDLVIYDKPRELGKFRTFCKGYYDSDHCEECKYFIDGRGYEYDESDCGCNGWKPLSRPPQSWCYVEELNE